MVWVHLLVLHEMLHRPLVNDCCCGTVCACRAPISSEVVRYQARVPLSRSICTYIKTRMTPRATSAVQDASAPGLAVEPVADVRDGILVEASVKAAGDVADMRRRQQVRQRAERMVERQRLLVEDVDGSAGDRLGFERRNEICLNHDRSARRVYQARRRLHEC